MIQRREGGEIQFEKKIKIRIKEHRYNDQSLTILKGISIDILKIFTVDGIDEIKKQLSGMTDDMKAQIEALKNDTSLSPEEQQVGAI